MVLTNFECWAHGGNVVGGGVGINADIEHQFGGGGDIIATSRHVDLFNPRAVQQTLGQASHQQQQQSMDSQTIPNSAVSHISSNGYYGFSYVNAAHELNNNNNDMLNNNNMTYNNNNNNNNNNDAYNNGTTVTRCKKRFLVNESADVDVLIARNIEADNTNHGQHVAAKRCRYDDDFAAQYFNDFFNMQTATNTQIGTQACLMETEDSSQILMQSQEQQELLNAPHQIKLAQQQQVDVAMTATPQHTTNNTSSNAYNSSLQQQQQLPQQQQQVHFQGHLHRTNRDVSRCMLSHMI